MLLSREWHALAADVALGVPEITPEQATRLRRYIAATAYNCMSPDYVPPREAGYCWGSANMMEQLRFRGATLMACLVPNHPQSKGLAHRAGKISGGQYRGEDQQRGLYAGNRRLWGDGHGICHHSLSRAGEYR